MKTGVWVVIIAAIAVDALKTPTHIIKFKESVNSTAEMMRSLILNQHRTYLLANHQKISAKSRKALSEDEMLVWADSLSKKLSLESIAVDKDFLAVAGVFGDENFVEYLHTKDDIEYVEANQIYTTALVVPRDETPNQNIKKGLAANWGLARITQRQKQPLDEYFFDESAGTGIHVYVLDSGIHVNHRDFENRASLMSNFIYDEEDHDLNGHGIKEVMSIAEPGKSVINLSISGSKSRVLNEILDKAVTEYKIPVFVSAGNNGGMDACFLSPSSNPNVFTVGASDMDDHVTYYSNVGSCVQIYAPGHRITSAWIGGTDAMKVVDGTSMSNPHVTGIAAALLAHRNFENPAQLYDVLTKIATKDVLLFNSSRHTTASSNLLAYHDLGQPA
ncbi:serine protease [Apophysomyces ossiformis]|uniref:Serine protease n=1 Tax=Apophysomyces ossiformis TaxID=679940 RepID=A0A8H7EKH7_9FUNG|nr:serine protease [Apophysomyces ossiformis]